MMVMVMVAEGLPVNEYELLDFEVKTSILSEAATNNPYRRSAETAG